MAQENSGKTAYYRVKLGAGLKVDQQTLLEKLRTLGGDAIQTSDGLFVALDDSESSTPDGLQNLQRDEKIEFTLIDPSSDADLTPDMKTLISKHEMRT